ncbi:MAG: 2-oxoglutarate dehydrogenase complex dihydrolipoyllysine-residue succinyltransferase [Candidatus Eutrophobiaceae bacterium]
MLVDIKVPVLAESVTEATLMDWHKKPGDQVKRGDSLIDIETDKVTLEVAALKDGVLVEILRGNGEIVESDEIIGRIDDAAGAAVAEFSSEEGDDELDLMDSTTPLPERPEVAAESPEPASSADPIGDVQPSNPAARHMAEQNDLDLRQVQATIKPGRITKEDVARHLSESTAAGAAMSEASPIPAVSPPPAVAAAPPPPPSAPAPALQTTVSDGERKQERVRMTRLRKRAAERLLSAQHESAILTTFNEVDMQAVMELRIRYRDEFEKNHGVKLGFMSFFTRAAVEALKKFPVVNASVDGEDILYHNYYDIGIAVSAPRGLVVPIVRDADTLSLSEIETAIRNMGLSARDNKLTLDDLIGGTFTITNGGIFGSLLSTPIINPPQSAILGMHKIQERPMVVDGKIVARPIMYLALSYDHRIIDGREAVQFLVSIKQQIEDPSRLLLQL